MPKTDELRIRNCASKDRISNATICDILQRILDQKKAALNVVSKKPNKEWAIVILSTLDPGNILFTKDFVPSMLNPESQ